MKVDDNIESGTKVQLHWASSLMEAMAIMSNIDKIIFDKSDINLPCRSLTEKFWPKLKQIIKCLGTCSSSLHLFASVSDGYLIISDGYLIISDGYLIISDGNLIISDGNLIISDII